MLVDLVGLGARFEAVHVRLDARLELLVLDVGEPGDDGGVLLTQVFQHLALDLVDLLALGDEVAALDADVLAGDAKHGFLVSIGSPEIGGSVGLAGSDGPTYALWGWKKCSSRSLSLADSFPFFPRRGATSRKL